MRQESPLATWDDAEEAYEKEFPRQLSHAELVHQEMVSNEYM